MKVVIFDGYGDSFFPEFIQKQIKGLKFPLNRTGKIIDILESYPNSSNINKTKLNEILHNLTFDKILRIGNDFYCGSGLYKLRWTIIEVDTSRRWTINVYDESEFVEYLEFECLSEEMNYWE